MNQNEPVGGNPPPIPIQQVSDFEDRRTGLLVFGILEILLGALCVLLAGFMVLGQMMVSRTTGTALSTRMILPGVTVYLGLAAAFVWLGIGSIQCRRWARALLLIVAWCWLCVGVVAVPLTAFLTPRALANAAAQGQGVPQGVMVMVMVFQILFMTLFMVAVPGALVLFYRSKHVKATCEARDPVRRWTDGCPLPVLGVACALWLGSVMMLAWPLIYGGVMPLFGVIVTGLPATLLVLGLGGFWFWLGWMWYQLKTAGWWALMAALVVFAISGFVTFSRIEMTELYRKMGYPEAQVELIKQQGLVSNRFMVWNAVGWLVPMLGYVIWTKRFFRELPGGIEDGQRERDSRSGV